MPTEQSSAANPERHSHGFEKLKLLPGDAIVVPEKLKLSSKMDDLLQITQFMSQAALTAAALSVSNEEPSHDRTGRLWHRTQAFTPGSALLFKVTAMIEQDHYISQPEVALEYDPASVYPDEMFSVTVIEALTRLTRGKWLIAKAAGIGLVIGAIVSQPGPSTIPPLPKS